MTPVPLAFPFPVGALEAVSGTIPSVVLVLVLLNLVTRLQAHRVHVRQAREGDDDEELSRYGPHEASNLLLLLASFAFTVVEPHGGIVLTSLVLGTFLTDFFEFESRKVEARNGLKIERPKSSIAASTLVVLYAGFQSVFFLIEPLWNAIV
jgi:ABC-type Fe3+ transport system permease subunit